MPGLSPRAHVGCVRRACACRTRRVRRTRRACRTRRARKCSALFAALFGIALVAAPGVAWLGLPAPAHGGAVQSGVQEACLRFEGEKVWLRGVLELVNFPGPPNYRSIHRGDRPVPEFVFALEDPLCLLPEAHPQSEAGRGGAGSADAAAPPQPGVGATAPASSPQSGAPLRVRRLQALPADAPVEVAALGNLGEAVWLYGSLQRPASKRHHLPVLLKLVRVSAGPGIPPPGRPEAPASVSAPPGLPPSP